MAFTVQNSITIDRPREPVWNYVVANDAWRRPFIQGVRQITGGEPAVGTRYEDSVKMMGQETTIVNELLSYEPPATMTWTQVEQSPPLYTVKGSCTLEPVDGKTRFTLRATYRTKGLWGVLTPLLRWQIQSNVYPQILGQLKERLET